MANKVLTIFEGDSKPIFATADAVERRLKDLQRLQLAAFQPNPYTAAAQGPSPATAALDRVIAAQKDLTKTVESEATKRATAEIAAAKSVTGALQIEAAKRKSIVEQGSNPLNPSSSARLKELGITPAAGAQVPAAAVVNNAAKLENFRQSIGGYKAIETAAANATAKAQALNAAASLLPPELQQAANAASSIAPALGTSVVTLGVVGAAIVATTYLAKEAAEGIQAAAQKRLRYEELVTGEYSKQIQFANELAKKRAEATEGRAFNRFVSTAPPELIDQSRSQALAQYNAAAAKAADVARRQAAVDAVVQNSSKGVFGFFSVPSTALETQQRLKGERAAAESEAQKFYDKILQLDKGLEDSNQRRVESGVAITKFAESARIDAIRDRIKFEEDANRKAAGAAKARLEEIEKQKQRIEGLGKAFRGAFDTTNSRFAQVSGNPILSFLDAADARMQNLIKSTEGFSDKLRNTLVLREQASNRIERDGLLFDTRLASQDLFDRARDLRRGYNAGDEDSIMQRAQRRLYPNYSSQQAYENALQKEIEVERGIDAREAQNDLTRRINLAGAAGLDQMVADQKLLALTRGLSPGDLNSQQRDQLASAAEREASRQATADTEAAKQRTESLTILKEFKNELMQMLREKGVKVDLAGQAITSVEIHSKDIDASKRQRSVYGKKISTKDSMLP